MKIQVIVNPTATRRWRGRLEKELGKRFNSRLAGIEHTSSSQHATELAKRAAQENIDTIVAVGGDGTVNSVLNGIIGTDVALGIIPQGTANDLATFHGIPPEIGKACDIVLERFVRRSDVICVNRWCYISAGGVGVSCEIARTSNRIKLLGKIGYLTRRTLKSKLYVLIAVAVLLRKNSERSLLEVQSDGQLFTVDAFTLSINNQPFLGKHFLVSPGAVYNDGLFDVCLIENTGGLEQKLFVLMHVLKGRHVELKTVKNWQAREMVLRCEKPLRFFGDGEDFLEASELEIKAIPGALNLIVPVSRT